VAQVSIRIESTASAAFNDGIQDGATFAGLGFADEQPVLFAEGGWPDGIFHKILIDLDAPIFEVNAKERPQVQRVVDGQAHSAAGQVAPLHFQAGQNTMEPLVNGPGLISANHATQSRTTSTPAEFSLNVVEVSDLAQEPVGDAGILLTRFVKLPTGMSLMWSPT
jgi:hypothetical protein